MFKYDPAFDPPAPVVDLEVAAFDRQTMLLGRDILQHFILTLDGKAGAFTLIDP